LSAVKKLWKNDYFKTAITIALIIGIVLGFFLALQLALNTPYPALTVESGSMCLPQGRFCDGWSHPFDQTLHIGDILIIQGVNPADLNTNYPNSDIIVYRDPASNKLIVHRIVSEQNINGTMYFKTKGDANGPIFWPDQPNYYDDIPDIKGVPQDLVVGRVVMRIPWFGWITLFMRNNPWGLPVIITLILLLVIVEFIVPMLRQKKKQTTQQNDAQAKP
jgi:signal peptidase I